MMKASENTVMAQPTENDKARRVAAMFARISRRYDFMNTVMTGGMHGRWRRKAARIAVAGQAPGIALDVGTGTGGFVFELAGRPEVQGAIGLDFVPQMLALARAQEMKKRPARPVVWSLGDAMELPLPDGTFMCATAGFAMRNVADLRKALSEMARVVRPGGRVVILEMTRQDKARGSRLPQVYFRRVVPLLGQLLAGDRDAYTYLPDSVGGFPTAQGLASLMEGAGLTNVRWQLLGLGLVALHVGEVG